LPQRDRLRVGRLSVSLGRDPHVQRTTGRWAVVVVSLAVLTDGTSVACRVGSGLPINNLLYRLLWLGSVR
jgi:hypothetical protein